MENLPELVQSMLDPQFYPHHPEKVELVQTQMSFLFLADGYVYKVKKPVNLGYLDYTTLEKRRFFCEREVELNRRLCPDVYMGVVPLIKRGNRFAIGERVQGMEYAVVMRRLPQEAMLNILLLKDRVSAGMMSELAKKLAVFHRKADTSQEISQFGRLDTIRVNTEENFAQTYEYIGKTISQPRYERIKRFTDGFMGQNAALFDRRIMEGRIRDCHGDLHAAHICFADGIHIYDCIEFNDRFRYCDVASEIAFLAMDLDHYGRADLSRSFVGAYVEASGDRELLKLLNFYKCYRAYVRGKVEGFKLNDSYISPDDKKQTMGVAGSYFDLAYSYTRSRPILMIMVGLVGTGKSTLAQALARRLGVVNISSDITRKRLANIPVTEAHFDEYDTGIYSAEFTRKTYDAMFDEARDILTEGGSVVLDASFIRSADRSRAKKLAEEAQADFFIIECCLEDGIIKRRLDNRVAQGSISDGRREILEPQKRQFEPVEEAESEDHLKVDTSHNVDELVSGILSKV